jgi:hypothetical protein
MPEYKISYTETNIYYTIIKSDDEDEAIVQAKKQWYENQNQFKHIGITDNFFQYEGEV